MIMNEDAHSSTGIFQKKVPTLKPKISRRGKKKEIPHRNETQIMLAPIEEKRDDPLEDEDMEDKKNGHTLNNYN